VGPDIEVETHIEPMETREIHGRDANPALVVRIAEALSKKAAAQGFVRNIHDVRVRHTSSGYVVNFHCSCDPKMTVDATHDEVDAVERALRADFPDVTRIVGHAEPAPKIG
jgi:divalent metal cation (Fe/Co/Zn/Cd) transporter